MDGLCAAGLGFASVGSGDARQQGSKAVRRQDGQAHLFLPYICLILLAALPPYWAPPVTALLYGVHFDYVRSPESGVPRTYLSESKSVRRTSRIRWLDT